MGPSDDERMHDAEMAADKVSNPERRVVFAARWEEELPKLSAHIVERASERTKAAVGWDWTFVASWPATRNGFAEASMKAHSLGWDAEALLTDVVKDETTTRRKCEATLARTLARLEKLRALTVDEAMRQAIFGAPIEVSEFILREHGLDSVAVALRAETLVAWLRESMGKGDR